MADILDLIQIHFEEIAKWQIVENKITYKLNSEKLNSRILIKNILYAFVKVSSDETLSEVMYIGKTTKGIITRLNQYKSGYGQATNNRINQNIKSLLSNNSINVKILVLVDIPALQWGGYNLNLPAGLEDGLIVSFRPEWNNTHGGLLKTSSEEFEDFDTQNNESDTANEVQKNIDDCVNPCGTFEWKLGETYYNTGFMNPGVTVDQCFGREGEIVELHFPNGNIYRSEINRKANKNGTVRLRFNSAVIYIQSSYNIGEILEIKICEKNKLFVI
jgi:hypothetical protein